MHKLRMKEEGYIVVIILDAMGGDNAPDATIKGAVKAVKEIGENTGRWVDLFLVTWLQEPWDLCKYRTANIHSIVGDKCLSAFFVYKSH